MKNPFSKKQLNKAKPFNVEKPSYRKIVESNHVSDCKIALFMVSLWAVLVSWVSWLLLRG